MIKICNHLFENYLKKDILKKYKYIIFETNDKENVKKLFQLRFLDRLGKIKIRRPIEDPIVEYYDKLGYFITYSNNFDGSENYNIVIIEVPSVDIQEFEFIELDNLDAINSEEMLFISKYQILWDTIFLNLYTNVLDKKDYFNSWTIPS